LLLDVSLCYKQTKYSPGALRDQHYCVVATKRVQNDMTPRLNKKTIFVHLTMHKDNTGSLLRLTLWMFSIDQPVECCCCPCGAGWSIGYQDGLGDASSLVLAGEYHLNNVLDNQNLTFSHSFPASTHPNMLTF